MRSNDLGSIFTKPASDLTLRTTGGMFHSCEYQKTSVLWLEH